MEKTLEEKLAMCEKQEAELQFKHFLYTARIVINLSASLSFYM